MSVPALDTFCGSQFWDWQLSWNTSNPDLTPCFQKTVLVWIPCGFLWLFAPLETYFLLKSTSRNIPWTVFNLSKSVLSTFLVLLCLIELGYYAAYRSSEDGLVSSAEYYSSFIKLISFLLVLCFTVAGKMRGIHSSGIIFLFWMILTITEMFAYRSYIMHALNDIPVMDEFSFFIYMVYYPLVVTQFFLMCFADTKREPTYPHEKESPELSASFLSRVLFWWFNSLVITGRRRALTFDDLWTINSKDRSEIVIPKFDKHWNEQLVKHQIPVKSASYNLRRGNEEVKFSRQGQNKKLSVVFVLVKTFGSFFVSGSVFKLFHDLLQFASPQVLKLLIGFVSSNEPLWKGVFYSILMFVAAILQSIMLSFYFHRMYIIGMRIRSSLISAIYRKALRLSSASRRESTVGEIVNLMSVDVQRFIDLMPFINLLWSAPLQIALSVAFLWEVLGPSVLAGLGVMILMIPLNGFIADLTKKLQVKQMKSKDERVKLMNEILSGIKVLKLYAWEESFGKQVTDIRSTELKRLRRIAYLNSVSYFIWTCTPFLVSLMSFTTFVLSDSKNILDARRAFVALTLFHILRFPLSMLPMLISMLVQASVSVKRLNKFLANEDLQSYVNHDSTESAALILEHGTFTWSRDEAPILKDITLSIPKGSLVAVVGQVGSGKSSLLSSLLGDMDKLEGSVNVEGSVAYVPQQAWIQNATVRDNILFYSLLKEERYQKVLDVCALKPDLAILPGGDITEIGEKGINLSGGQKQRVSLARAVYNDSDIYFLDDPLSAVDAHVGKHIFEKVIGPKGILKDKTRVLVTHSLTFLPHTDVIVVMKDGAILETGTYHELLDKKGAFAEFLLQYLAEEQPGDVDNMDIPEVELVEEIISKVGTPELGRQLSKTESESSDISLADRKAILRTLSRKLSQDSSLSDQSTSPKKLNRSRSRLDRHESSPTESRIMEETLNKPDDFTKIIKQETAETEEVKLDVYLQYMKAISYDWVIASVLAYCSLQGFSLGSNLWLSQWSNDALNENGSQDLSKRDLRLGIYGIFGAAQGITVFLASFALARGTTKASSLLHADLLKNILHSPMAFFETTPLGRTVNRFAKDIDTVDVTLPMTIRSWIACFLQVVATIIVISLETPSFLLIILPVSLLYYFIQTFYVPTSRQLKRLDSITRSPIYSHFSETLAGVSTIRAYNAQKQFIDLSHHHVDTNHKCYYPSIVANRWLAVRLEFCGNCIVLFAALFAVLGRESLSPGSVGLSVSYALSVTATLNWMVRMSSDLETNIVSVERILEYSTTPTEASWTVDDHKPEKSWPQKGEVKFDHYSTRYREGLDLVLKDLNCFINPGEKVGIVGRTGAGKSSLTLSLFRIIEATEGCIFIDGVDISKIGLHDLRSNITIIPQDPVLFSGTLRINLDPFNKHSDDEIWMALEHSHLKNFVSALEGNLHYVVAEGGENLSVGQRQLVCLARALLRKSKVLVLDEATAAVDLETDNLIQSTIRSEFSYCTIFTIAHRLNTIMDYNRVMVLDRGKIVEFDSAQVLLHDKKSVFYSMASDAGII